jgi:hypothetical protein
MLCYLTRDEIQLDYLLDKHLKIIKTNYEEALTDAMHNGVSFLVDEPGVQTRRSFNPVELTARGFYGQYYNGFNCTMDWSAKCQIIIGYRKRTNELQQSQSCPLFSLNLDIIKYIFEMVDYLHFKEIMNNFNLYTDKRSNLNKAVFENQNEQSESYDDVDDDDDEFIDSDDL